jgi:hypothetical protein
MTTSDRKVSRPSPQATGMGASRKLRLIVKEKTKPSFSGGQILAPEVVDGTGIGCTPRFE